MYKRQSYTSPCTSTELFKVYEWPSLDSTKYKTSGLCITGHASEADNPCCKHIRTYEKNKKDEWQPVADRFDKSFVSNEKTLKSLSETPKVQKEVEVKEREEVEEDDTSDESANTDDTSDESGDESVSEDPYRCPKCLKTINNPTDEYLMVNQNFLISKI